MCTAACVSGSGWQQPGQRSRVAVSTKAVQVSLHARVPALGAAAAGLPAAVACGRARQEVAAAGRLHHRRACQVLPALLRARAAGSWFPTMDGRPQTWACRLAGRAQHLLTRLQGQPAGVRPHPARAQQRRGRQLSAAAQGARGRQPAAPGGDQLPVRAQEAAQQAPGPAPHQGAPAPTCLPAPHALQCTAGHGWGGRARGPSYDGHQQGLYTRSKQRVARRSMRPAPDAQALKHTPCAQEITRRVNLEGIWQAAYTAGVVLPKPAATCQYWHRSLNPKKLISINFSRLLVSPSRCPGLLRAGISCSTGCRSRTVRLAHSHAPLLARHGGGSAAGAGGP